MGHDPLVDERRVLLRLPREARVDGVVGVLKVLIIATLLYYVAFRSSRLRSRRRGLAVGPRRFERSQSSDAGSRKRLFLVQTERPERGDEQRDMHARIGASAHTRGALIVVHENERWRTLNPKP